MIWSHAGGVARIAKHVAGAMTGIFISYRREDTTLWAGRLYERLANEFNRDQLFMDADNIAPGVDFMQILEEQICRLRCASRGDWQGMGRCQGTQGISDGSMIPTTSYGSKSKLH